jgi:hypothetical protein
VSALTDIRAALKAAPPAVAHRERVILIGDSAEMAVYAEQLMLKDEIDPRIDGVTMRRTDEFRGWALRDVDRLGVWHDVTGES